MLVQAAGAACSARGSIKQQGPSEASRRRQRRRRRRGGSWTLAPARRYPLDRLLRSSAGAVLRLQAGGRRRRVRRGPLGGAPDPSPAFRRLALLLAGRCGGALDPHGCCRANRCGREHCGRTSRVPRLRLLVSKEGWGCFNRVIWPSAQAGSSNRRGAAGAQRGSGRRAWRRRQCESHLPSPRTCICARHAHRPDVGAATLPFMH